MKLKLLTPIIATSMLLASNSAFAVLADDVVCTGCVNDSDLANKSVTRLKIAPTAINESKIANKAVTRIKIAPNAINAGKIADKAITSSKIADEAVTSIKIAPSSITTGTILNGAVSRVKIAPSAINEGKIADGAVTEAKLSLAVQDKLNAATGGGGIPTHDRPTTSTATVREYALTGSFLSSATTGSCAGQNMDAERQTIARTPLAGGTHITVTRQRFVGGLDAVSCHYQKLYFFDNGTEHVMYKREKYNNSGITLNSTDAVEDFDATTNNDSGLINRRDGMAVGLVYFSGALWTRNGANPGIGLNTSVLLDADQTLSIYEDTPTPVDVTGCNVYLEDRSSDYMGTAKIFREVCDGIGIIFTARRNADGTSQLWELTSHNAI